MIEKEYVEEELQQFVKQLYSLNQSWGSLKAMIEQMEGLFDQIEDLKKGTNIGETMCPVCSNSNVELLDKIGSMKNRPDSKFKNGWKITSTLNEKGQLIVTVSNNDRQKVEYLKNLSNSRDKNLQIVATTPRIEDFRRVGRTSSLSAMQSYLEFLDTRRKNGSRRKHSLEELYEYLDSDERTTMEEQNRKELLDSILE